MYQKVKEMVDAIYPQLVSIRRDIHQHPELGLEEYRTSALVLDYLKQWDIKVAQLIGETAIVGLIEGNEGKKTIGLRADMDALPIEEQTGAVYASLNAGKMHACGHDVHTTILLGAAYILNELKDEFEGNVKLFFQPAEETVGGAKPMIEAGCLENPKVDHVLGLHVRPTLNVGEVGFHYGKCHAASDTIFMTIKGKKSHGAYPQDGIDAILIAAQVITSLQSLISRNLSPFESAVISLGMIEGGDAGNIVCGEVKIRGTLRTLDQKVRLFMKRRIIEVAENTAKAFGGEAYVYLEEGYAPLINDRAITDAVAEVAKQVVGEENVIMMEHPSLGVEDFAYFAEALPSCFYNLGTSNPEKGFQGNLHESTFDIDEEAIKIGVCLQVLSTLHLLKQ
ncbi:MAG: amidohydrolase [Turicibacter sp.]|nr:amidohydrolase [Turicibacter sp.]